MGAFIFSGCKHREMSQLSNLTILCLAVQQCETYSQPGKGPKTSISWRDSFGGNGQLMIPTLPRPTNYESQHHVTPQSRTDRIEPFHLQCFRSSSDPQHSHGEGAYVGQFGIGSAVEADGAVHRPVLGCQEGQSPTCTALQSSTFSTAALPETVEKFVYIACLFPMTAVISCPSALHSPDLPGLSLPPLFVPLH